MTASTLGVKFDKAEPPVSLTASGIRDNYRRGTAANFLRAKIERDSRLSVVSAYFTIYAFDALKGHLAGIDHLDFLFGEPRFINALDPDRTEKKAFLIDSTGLHLANTLAQKRVARECADWLRAKVEIRSIRESNLLHGKMYHISRNGVEDALVGSSNFTVRGLGLGLAGNNIELNLEVDSNRDRRDLKAWFDEIWNDEALVVDVKGDVLAYLEQLYQNHAPEFIYFKTLFHIFEDFLADQAKGGLLDQNIKIVDTDVWKALFEFQRDGVKGARKRAILLAGIGAINVTLVRETYAVEDARISASRAGLLAALLRAGRCGSLASYRYTPAQAHELPAALGGRYAVLNPLREIATEVFHNWHQVQMCEL